jgi:hypothetical protein
MLHWHLRARWRRQLHELPGGLSVSEHRQPADRLSTRIVRRSRRDLLHDVHRWKYLRGGSGNPVPIGHVCSRGLERLYYVSSWFLLRHGVQRSR